MAQKVAAATGAWSAAATWNSVTNTPTLHASTNITISTSNLFTATFTAPNTTNACTGVLLYIVAVGTGGTVTVTLQESTVDTAAARSIAVTALVANTWVYFRFATPYVFTTTGAGAYRFKIVNAGATGTTTAAADSGGANIAYRATDDRTGVPASTDDVDIPGQNQVTPITVTMDGTQTIGSGTDTVLAARRSLGNAISTGNLGVLAWDMTADATLTCKGNIVCNSNSGELQMGTVAAPMPAARVARLRFDMAATGNHGLRVFDGGKLTLQGTPKSSTTLWKAKLSSGVGTAASPAIMDTAVDWSVGDEVVIGSTDTYDHTEYRFIITKNSATSYVWSATAGGAEAALTYTHTTDAWVVNIGRNVLIDSTNIARAYYIYSNAAGSVVDADWARFDVIGSNNTDKTGFATETNVVPAIDYCVFSRHYEAIKLESLNLSATLTGNIAVNQSGTTANSFFVNAANKITFVDCFVFAGQFSGFRGVDSFGCIYTRCYAVGCNQANNSSHGGFFFQTSGALTLNDCETHCNRVQGARFQAATDVKFTNFLCGTKGQNTSIDIAVETNTYNTITFINSSFGSTTFVSNYLNMLTGSELLFQAYNGNNNNHTWYTNTGAARSSGAGLVDTTNKTAGTLTVRIAPEDSTAGFQWEFLVGIKANTAASIFGFAQKNVAFGTSVCTIELFLPGSTVADATATLDNTTGSWQVFSLAANYSGSVASFATVRITAKTVTAAAYVYFTDFYNGTNVLTGLQAWYNGKPTPVMTDLLGDPASVWAILTSTLTTPGTIGYQLTNDLDDIQTQLQTIDDFLDTEIAAILAAVDTEVAAIKAKTDNLTFTVAGHVDANTLLIEGVDATNQINAEVVDVLTVDTFAESSGVPAATASIERKIAWLATLARNKITQTATDQVLRNDGDSGNVGTAPVSDDNITATRGKWN